MNHEKVDLLQVEIERLKFLNKKYVQMLRQVVDEFGYTASGTLKMISEELGEQEVRETPAPWRIGEFRVIKQFETTQEMDEWLKDENKIDDLHRQYHNSYYEIFTDIADKTVLVKKLPYNPEDLKVKNNRVNR